MEYIEHPLIKPNALEARAFQVNIARRASERSTLVVIPTGLGKTVIALMVIAETLRRRGPLILFLAPTKPLVEQHADTLKSFLLASPVVTFTGEIPPAEREKKYRDAAVIVSTPQVIYNDLLAGRFSLQRVNLIIFDEAHRAVGNYAYVPIARRYLLERPQALSMGLTASPGWDEKKIIEVCTNLGIDHVEIRTRTDPDVKPYIQEIELNWVKVDVPEALRVVKNTLEELMGSYLMKMAQMGLIYNPKRTTTKELVEVGKKIRKMMAQGGKKLPPHLYYAASLHAQALKISHALELAETQGPRALFHYLDRLVEETYSPSASKAAKAIVKNPLFRRAYNLAEAIKDMDHPKVQAAINIVREQIEMKPDSRIILFSQYRDTATLLYERLSSLGDERIRPVRFVGQASRKGDRGLKQREQKEIVERFREGHYNVLIATSVAEEGLDIPSTDLVIFYEPVPSEIRTIQRRGRTGRTRMGKVVILITRETRDVAYFFSSIKKEKKMEAHLKRLKEALRQTTLLEDHHTTAGDLFLRSGTGEAKGEGADERGEIPPGEVVEREGREVGGRSSGGQLTLVDFAGVAGGESPARPTPPRRKEENPGGEPAENQDPEGETAESPVIWVDHRELSSPVAEHLRQLGTSPVPTTLPDGDYLLSEEVVIERKSAEDFISSLLDGRLFTQLRELKRGYPKPILVVEGDLEGAMRGVKDDALWGALSSIVVDLGVAVVRTLSPRETAMFLAATQKRLGKRKGGPPPLRKKRGGMTVEEQKRFVLEGLPHISSSTAQRLLEEFGTLKGVFSASEEELKKVKGIGEKKARDLYHLMNS